MRRLIDIVQGKITSLTESLGFQVSNKYKTKNVVDFEQYTEVMLKHSVTFRGTVFPKGTIGTVVDKYPDGISYEVEFSYPEGRVVPLKNSDLNQP